MNQTAWPLCNVVVRFSSSIACKNSRHICKSWDMQIATFTKMNGCVNYLIKNCDVKAVLHLLVTARITKLINFAELSTWTKPTKLCWAIWLFLFHLGWKWICDQITAPSHTNSPTNARANNFHFQELWEELLTQKRKVRKYSISTKW